MHQDVSELRDFYFHSPLGRVARRIIRARIGEYWPEARGQTVAGFGFAPPVLDPAPQGARRILALMPGAQGVMPWPAGQPNAAVLMDEANWPVETGRIDKLLLIHGLETARNPSLLLSEAWRVLGPGGSALFVVPHRAGLWAQRDRTPFGHGRPYSLGQLEALLRLHEFHPERHTAMLYMPPSERKFWMRSGILFERIGRRISLLAGAILMVEASKRPTPAAGTPVHERISDHLGVLAPKPGVRPI